MGSAARGDLLQEGGEGEEGLKPDLGDEAEQSQGTVEDMEVSSSYHCLYVQWSEMLCAKQRIATDFLRPI